MARSTSKIPVDKRHWLFGSIREFAASPLEFMEDLHVKHGELCLLDLVINKLIVTSSPEVMRHIFQTNHKNYIKDKAYQQLKLALGNGLLINEGESWKKQRRLAQPAFYKKRLEGLFQDMVGISEKYCNRLEKQRGAEEPVNMLSEMMHLTSDIVMSTLLGSVMESDKEEIEHAISEAQKYIMTRVRHPYAIPFLHLFGSHYRFRKNIKNFDRHILAVLAQRRQEGNVDHKDLLSMLMDAKDEEGSSMSDQQLRDEVTTIFVAGHETSANALTWTFYLLCQHPDIYQKVKKEVREVLDNRLPNFEDIRELTYLRMVVDESMRLYPPAHAVGRENLEEDELLGYHIPKNSMIFSSIWTLHRRADLWENPTQFDPERFRPERVKERPKFHYLPFAAGPRMCIGNNFALMEITLILAMMMQRFDFVLDKEHPVVLEPLVTLRPKYGMKIWIR